MKTFDKFFDHVDVMNAYEENWNEIKDQYKPYYAVIWSDYLQGTLF